MPNPELTWWPADDTFEITRDGGTLVCRDRNQTPVTPVPEAVYDTRRYPAWALITRPTEVDEAVAADAALTAARRSKPHDMAQKVERIANELPTTHLPFFYDRAARELIRYGGDRKRGATMFAQARAAESAAGALPIADEVWLELHLEFAALGALSTKAAADFVKALKNRATPSAAVAAVAQVAVLRARAGQAPWPQVPKQLSAFAKAAGLDELTVHRDLLEQLLAAEAVWESAAAMWTAWRPILVRVCADSARVRGLLLNLLPQPESMDGWWLELLDECGATAGLVGAAEPEAEPVGGRAAWLERTIWHPNLNATLRRRSRVSKLLPTQISELIVRMAPALRADGVPVRLEGPDYWTKRVDPRVLEACLANGVPVADLSGEAWLDLSLWLRGRRPDDELTTTAQDPRFAPAIGDWARKGDAAQLWAITSLRPFLSAPQEAATAPHPLDGPKIYVAAHEFGAVNAISSRAVPRLLYSLRMLTHTLREGTAASAEPGILRLGETADFAGRIEWIVLRAVAPSTPSDRRELLTALLAVWGESALADPATRIFHGTADIDRVGDSSWQYDFAADEHGVVMRTYYRKENPRPFMALTDGTAGAEPPSLGRVATVEELPVGWGTADRLRRLVELLREHGGIPRDPAAATVLAEGTGMSAHAAEMALAGLLGATGYTVPFMGTEERKTLGISAKQVEAGRAELAHISGQKRMDLLLGVLPDDPAELWQPGGTVALAKRIAANWSAQFGRAAAVPEATLAAAPDVGGITAQRLLAALVDPAESQILTTDIDSWLTPSHNGGVAWYTSEDYTIGTFTRWLTPLVEMICWAYASLPAGDPVRGGVPEAVRLLRERLAHPGLVLMAGTPHYSVSAATLVERFGATPYAGPESLPDTTADDGLTIVATNEGSTRVYFRPSNYGVDARTAELEDAVYFPDRSLKAARFLRGASCTEIVDRIASGTSLPVGAREADPRASVPDLVARVAEDLGLIPDAAALYLQLLAMPHPSDKNVRAWNGWNAAKHKAAASALVARGGLVIEEKRPKAGRGIFLPGGWRKARSQPGTWPIENWKIELLSRLGLEEDADWPRISLPELFAAAWKKAEAGAA